MLSQVINSIRGEVIKGNQIGRTIGFPTANLDIHDSSFHLDKGVYGVKAIFNNATFYGVMNIGNRPTFNDQKPLSVEVHLFDFDQEIYGKILDVDIHFFVRSEKRFHSIDDLVNQIHMDCALVKKKFLSL